jgi:hypothetical protein
MAQYGDNGEETTIDNDTGELVSAGAVGLQAITAAEINQAVLTAKQFPRRRDKEIINEIMGRATLNEQIAEKCNYLLPRGGKKIPGPSIRFAEIVRASYWNIRVAARFVALDTSDMERAAVIVEAVALDVETNQSEIVPVRRSIMSSAKEGRRPQIYSADMINQTMQAAVSIARRNAILTLVPQVLWISGYDRVIEVLKGSVDTLATRRVAMIESLQKAGVEPRQLFEVLGVKDDSDIKIDHMPMIRGIMTALREGESVDSVLGRTSAVETSHERVKNPLKDDPAPGNVQRQAATSQNAGGAKREQTESSGPVRGNAIDTNQADIVIEANGSISKYRGEGKIENILDRRVNPAFSGSRDEWFDMCNAASLPLPVDLINGTKSASTQGEKSDTTAEDRREPVEHDSDGVVHNTGLVENNAQPAAASGASTGFKPEAPAKDYIDAETYVAFMHDQIDAAGSKAAVTEVWGASRSDRNELLSADQIEGLTKYKEAKLKKLKGGA